MSHSATSNTSTFTTANNGVSDIWTITAADGSKATVHSQGGHVTSWVGSKGDERLYLSPKNQTKAGKPIRGGVPVIYPQFSNMGKGPSHGVARNRQWTRVDDGTTPGVGIFRFTIPKDDKIYPGAASTLELMVEVSDEQLKLTAKVTPNQQTKDKDFGFLFHTYFLASDLKRVKIEGFGGKEHVNGVHKGAKEVTDKDFHSLTGVFDSIFYNNRDTIKLVDNGFGRTLEISGSETLPDVVLWNPGKETIAKFGDLPQPDGYKNFICVEHGAVTRAKFPKPGQSWEGSQTIRVIKHDAGKMKSKL